MNHTYIYEVLEGDARSVGRQEARNLRGFRPASLPFFSGPFEGRRERLAEADRLLELNERWCPGLNEELAGFAEELGVPPGEVVYYTATMPRSSGCSQFVVLPDRTETGTTICARSYEWSTDDEMTLKTVRIRGSYAHTGFAVFTVGRLDGLNERGLWVSMSAANPLAPLPVTGGFRFWSLVRTILDRCASVEEACALAGPFPLAFHANLLVADRDGNAALIEKGPDRTAVRRSRSGFLVATNHYSLPETAPLNAAVMDHSLIRYRFVRDRLGSGKVSTGQVRAMLAGSFPDGLSCHYYQEWLGTLWSMYADLGEGTLHACFGPADIAENRFRTFSLQDPAGVTTFTAELPDEKAPAGTWSRSASACPEIGG